MFSFKNEHKQLYFKNNMAHGKMTDEETKTLFGFCKQNVILGDNADPNCRNKVKRSFNKAKLVTFFDGKSSEEFLKKCFHSISTSMI